MALLRICYSGNEKSDLKSEPMEKLFYSNKDIRELYEISEAQAYRHMRRMKEIYEIDENRLPRRGVLPVAIVKDYFHQGKKKKDA